MALWPLAGLLALALLQLVPLPEPLHRVLAPGSHAVWHPADPELARLLGGGRAPALRRPGDDAARRSRSRPASRCWRSSRRPPSRASAPRRRAVAAVAVSGFALSAYAILARARFGALLYGRFAVPTVAPFGPFVSKNHFAGWSVMAALLTVGLALGLAEASRRRSRDWTTDTRAGAVILALVATLDDGARDARLDVPRRRDGARRPALPVSLSLRLLGARRSGTALAPLGITILLGVALVSVVPREAQERITTLSGASFRLDTWRGALALAATSPVVGHGLGAFHDAYPRFKHAYGFVRVEHAENDYLETLAETGALGLGMALAGLASLLVAGGRGIAEGRESVTRGIGQGALAALVALAVHSGVDFNLRIPSNAALTALAAAAVAAVAGVRPRLLPRAVALALAVAALALGVATLNRAPGAGPPPARR